MKVSRDKLLQSIGAVNIQDIEEHWYVWRLIFSNVASMQEMETHWSLNDVIRANIALDYHQEIENQMMPKLPKTPRRS